MSKTVSARIPKEWHEELRERCNQIGCTVNDFLCGSIELALTGTTEQDFGDEDDDKEIDSSIKQKPQETHEGKIPTLHFHWENDKLVQDKTTWEEKSKTP